MERCLIHEIARCTICSPVERAVPDGWHIDPPAYFPPADAPAFHADAPFTVEPPEWIGVPVMVPFAEFDLYIMGGW